MKVAIMQPYFFPYIGYFQLIANVDKFFLLDDVQYIRHGWVNRNRILKPGGGWQYVTVPIESYHRDTLIKDIKPLKSRQWKDLILRQVEHYKKRAPYYTSVHDLLELVFSYDYENLTFLNYRSIKSVCEYLRIETPLLITSNLELDYTNINESGDWALEICKQVSGHIYLNPMGGWELFDVAKYQHSNVKIEFQMPPEFQYKQKMGKPFEANLSILDVLMFNSLDDVRKVLLNLKLY